MIDEKIRNKIKNEAEKYNTNYYDRAYAFEKTGYDTEICFPVCNKEDIQTKLEYKNKDSKNRLSELEKRLLKPNKSKADEQYIYNYIRKQHTYSITDFSIQYNKKYNYDPDCSLTSKTVALKLKTLYEIIGCTNIDRIPKELFEEVCAVIKKFAHGKHNLNRCVKNPVELREHLNDEERVAIYNFYIAVKKILLLEAENEEEYKSKVSQLRNDDCINRIYNVAKVLSNKI